MNWIFFLIMVIVNILAVFFALAPAFVTYADVPPPGITCSSCGTPEVQAALTLAAQYGREGILRQLTSSTPWVIALAAFNIVAFLLVLWILHRSRKPSESTR